MNGKKTEEEWNPDLAWDGTGFVHASKEFFEEERKRFESMSYEEIADYILFGSPWSIAFRNLGWTKTRNGSRIIYRREEYGSCYIEEFHNTSFSHETEELVIDGTKATYTHTINESLTDEKGRTKTYKPRIETEYGMKAVDNATGGIRRIVAIKKEGDQNVLHYRRYARNAQ